MQAAAGPPAWLLRAAGAQGLPLQSLGAMRAPPGVDRLLARSGKRLREGVPPSFRHTRKGSCILGATLRIASSSVHAHSA